MRRFFKATSYILIAGFFAIALSGCTKTPAANPNANNIIVWSFENDDVWAPVKKQFEKDNKGFTLVYQKQTFDTTYETRVLNSILSGQGPDVWSMPNDWVYRHKDKLVPRPDTKVALDLDNGFVPSVKQSVSFDGKVYAMAPTAQPLMVYYNQKLFSQALDDYESTNTGSANADNRKKAEQLLNNGVPSTWTDFAAAAKILTKKDGANNIIQSGVAMGTDRITNSADILYLLMLQNGTKIVSDDFKLAMFNLPKETPKQTSNTPGKSAMDFYTSFANPASPYYSWSNTLGNDIDAFGNAKAAMTFGYDDLQNTLAQKYPNLSYRKAAVPQLTSETDTFVDYAKFNAFGVSNISANPAIAWSAINLLTDTFNDDYVSATHLYTSKKASSYDTSLDARKSSNPEKIELSTAQTLIKGRYPVEFDNSIKDAIFAVNKGVQESQAALDLISASLTSDYLRKESW